jgi:hypothetical protein
MLRFAVTRRDGALRGLHVMGHQLVIIGVVAVRISMNDDLRNAFDAVKQPVAYLLGDIVGLRQRQLATQRARTSLTPSTPGALLASLMIVGTMCGSTESRRRWSTLLPLE